MNKLLIILLILLTGCTLGCTLLHPIPKTIGKSTIKQQAAISTLQNTSEIAASANQDRLAYISAYSFGISYDLAKETNDIVELTAGKLNDRIQALAGKPDFNEVQIIKSLVDELITNQIAGDKALSFKDKEIENLMNSVKSLEIQKNIETKKALALAINNAEQEDTIQSELNSTKTFWGLGGVAIGLFSFGSHIFWLLLILFILYFILRTAATFYPPAAVLWTVFSQIGAVLIKCVEGIFPKAISSLGLIESEVHNDVVAELAKLKADITNAAVSNAVITVNTSQITGSK